MGWDRPFWVGPLGKAWAWVESGMGHGVWGSRNLEEYVGYGQVYMLLV